MQTLRHLALVEETSRVDLSDLTRVADTLQKQALGDFAAIGRILTSQAASLEPSPRSCSGNRDPRRRVMREANDGTDYSVKSNLTCSEV